MITPYRCDTDKDLHLDDDELGNVLKAAGTPVYVLALRFLALRAVSNVHPQSRQAHRA